jgi:hypothetical protein
MNRIFPSRLLAIAAIALIVGLVALPATAEDQCDATLSPSLESENKTDSQTEYTFKVDVSSPANCATVYWNLKTVVTRASGEDQEKITSYVTEVRDGMTTAVAKLLIASDETLADWEIEKTRCEPCGAERIETDGVEVTGTLFLTVSRANAESLARAFRR